MKRSMITVMSVVVVMINGVASTSLGALVVDRGLPTANLNNAANSDRSNVTWAFAPNNTYFSGDDFQLPTLPAGQWRIDKLTIWGSAGSPEATDFHLADRYSQITLYGGLATGGVSSIASGNFVAGTNATDNPNISITPVNYANATEQNYQGSSGALRELWQVDFNNPGWVVDGNVTYQFGVQGLTVASGDYWFNHASNAALGGVTADGADNLYRWFDVTNLAQLDPPGTGSHYDNSVDSNGYGWDKSSDINVQISATIVPEPGTLALLITAGLGMLAYAWRRRRS